ncbi:phosphate transporter family protein [Canariomyces notabilis]|uniref:Phosphate transporter n=1 Tax=Canariomyces notabilis TaxID=2074819 RepID=A0AAN6YT93_9PEZI|nr:phosphate transporter family protein [Canariomyces arenarius]
MAVLERYDWIIALITIAFCTSSFGNGGNDVANSYATSVAARTLTMPQVGILAAITEFVGAVALGSRVTGTIKNDVIDISRFSDTPAVLVLAMACAEFGSAVWLIMATTLGFPVSTTQTIVGAIVGVGIASQATVSWGWKDGSVSQIAASWGIAPAIAAGFAAILFGTLKYSVLERKDSFKWAMRLIPWYLAFTGAVLALFITIELPSSDFEHLASGTIVGIILGTFGGVLLVGYAFFLPYFHRRLVRKDTRVRAWHIPLGPLLWRENPPLYFPGKDNAVVIDYYSGSHEDSSTESITKEKDQPAQGQTRLRRATEPEERFLAPVAHLPIYHPRRLWGYIKFGLLQGVTRDCVSHNSAALAAVHAAARRYDNRVEHLWTYAQVASAMMMSIAHGSNDVANAVGPWVAAYGTWQTGVVSEDVDTPVWILIVAGLLLGAGFWFIGFHIIRSLGNKITQLSPTRGYAMELGAAITVLLASVLGIPVSTTQCLCGAVLGVAMMNYDFSAVNWRQLAWIFLGWVLTLPAAGLIAGLLFVMAVNTPHFG